jgi:hypothetical protein
VVMEMESVEGMMERIDEDVREGEEGYLSWR